MKNIKKLIGVILCLTGSLSSIHAQQASTFRTAVSDLKILEARWGQEGSVGLTVEYTLKNPLVRSDNTYLRWSHFYDNRPEYENKASANITYEPDNKYLLVLDVPKGLIKANSFITYIVMFNNKEYNVLGYDDIYFKGKKDPSVRNVIQYTFKFKIIKKDGYLQVEGVKNSLRENLRDDYTEEVSSDVPAGVTLEAEKNPATGTPYECVAADGLSYLKIKVSAPEAKSVTYKIMSEEGKVSIAKGVGEITFRPPTNISEDIQFYTKNLPQGRSLRYYTNSIIFTIENAKGDKQEVEFPVNYCRPPVILIHGFTGDISTWELLDQYLTQNGFMSNRENYYLVNSNTGTMDIKSQAEFLASIIKLELISYQKSNVKMAKADLVCHSMGGLIARYYSTIHPNMGADVRKIITVGTPNHGVFNTSDLLTGKLAAYLSDTHKGMARDVDASSPVMQQINQRESEGAHLNKNIEYGNIYVEGTDGVVEGRSARLNGVQEVLLTGMKHSPSIPNVMGYGDKSITTSFLVFGKILNWLNNPIAKATLNMNKWNMDTDVKAGGETDLSGKGHMLKVTSGSVKLNVLLKKLESMSGTKAEIIYPDGTVMNILPNSKISYNDNLTELLIDRGGALFNVKKQQSKFVVIEPSLKVGVRGTCFEVRASDNGKSDVFLYEGELEIINLSGTKIIKTGESASAQNENGINTGTFNTESRFTQQWAGNFNGLTNLKSFMGVRNPLFANVSAGGTLANPKNASSNANNDQTGSTNCLGQLKMQFIVSVGTPINKQQQMIAKQITDQNNWEKRWFEQAEAAFKNGAAPKPLSGTYRPTTDKKPGEGKYYSETVTIFKTMKIKKVEGNADGFRLFRGDSRTEEHFYPIRVAEGKTVKCGSYKIYVDPDEKIEKTWVTITFE